MTGTTTLQPCPADALAAEPRWRRAAGLGTLAFAVLLAVLPLVPAGFRAGAGLGLVAAWLLSMASLRWAANALKRRQPARGADPSLKAVVLGFGTKLVTLAGGTLLLHFSGQQVFAPVAFAVACAGGCVACTVPALAVLTRGGQGAGGGT